MGGHKTTDNEPRRTTSNFEHRMGRRRVEVDGKSRVWPCTKPSYHFIGSRFSLGPCFGTGDFTHKCFLRTDVTPNTTPYQMEKLPELN